MAHTNSVGYTQHTQKINFSNATQTALTFSSIGQKLIDKEKIYILMIDDSNDDIDLFKELIRVEANINHSITVYHKPSEAIEALKNCDTNRDFQKPDIIVLDISMPEMNGHITLDKLRSIKDLENIPIIVHSSQDHMKDIKQVKMNHGQAFFAKPINVKEFLRFLGKK